MASGLSSYRTKPSSRLNQTEETRLGLAIFNLTSHSAVRFLSETLNLCTDKAVSWTTGAWGPRVSSLRINGRNTMMARVTKERKMTKVNLAMVGVVETFVDLVEIWDFELGLCETGSKGTLAERSPFACFGT